MRVSTFLSGAGLAVSALFSNVLAQIYTDPGTGISFGTVSAVYSNTSDAGGTNGNILIGLSLPPSATTTDSPDYIGMITGAINGGSGWTGISHGAVMTNSLLLMAWAYGGEIYTSFRYAAALATPALYDGNVQLIPISQSINANNFTLIYRCVNCLLANATEGIDNSYVQTSQFFVFSYAQSLGLPQPPTDPDGTVIQHDNGQGDLSPVVSTCTFASYSKWATMSMTGAPTPTSSIVTTTYSARTIPTGVTYDYIVAGGGAGGIPFADKVSAAGKKTLLIERGPPSTYQWAGSGGPAWNAPWLAGQPLTRFDVPGLCNEIWVAPGSIPCNDIGVMAGCVLGGGTAVNAGLWWNPNPIDWDYNFPAGWKSTDMAAAAARVFSRIPGEYATSVDGVEYLQQGFGVVTAGLAAAGWTSVVANSVPGQKNRTYSHTPFMFSGGQRGGPLATYLVTAHARSNFALWTNTTVKRVIRRGGHITGVEVEPYGDGGYKGIVNVTTTTGRVVLSAGTFGTAKILFRSGIGPTDQLTIVASSTDGPTMVNSTYWIPLPVGYNLDDHLNTDMIIQHPNITFYDFYAAWSNPIAADKALYLNKRSGILAQAAPNIGPMFWEEITGADGIVRQIQWTARVEGNWNNTAIPTAMTLSQYLGRGSVSRGRATISKALNMGVATVPYLQNAGDLAAVITAYQNVVNAMSKVKNLTFAVPYPGQTVTNYVNSLLVNTGRTANHWVGTAKMGTDDGRSGGTAVVNTNALVYGTDNLFIVDASIFPGIVSTNPSALIVTAAERASDLILAMANVVAAPRYASCGGATYSGVMACAAPYTCTYVSEYYWQCL